MREPPAPPRPPKGPLGLRERDLVVAGIESHQDVTGLYLLLIFGPHLNHVPVILPLTALMWPSTCASSVLS